MGQETYKIPLSMFADNRRKLVNKLLEAAAADDDDASTIDANNAVIVPDGSLIFLQGGESQTRNDTDHEPLFRQESYMWWLTGVKEPDVNLLIEINYEDASTGIYPKTTLFIPKLPQEYATIMGKIRTPEEWKELYQVDNVLYNDDIISTLELWANNGSNCNNGISIEVLTKEGEEKTASAITTAIPATATTTHSIPAKKLLLMQGINTDSGNMYELPQQLILDKCKNLLVQSFIDTTTLFPILANCRVYKSSEELRVLQFIANVSSMGHVYVMKHTKPGMYEYQCESLFQHYCYYNYGCRLVSYTSICACGPNPAILHYGHAGEPNSRQLLENDTCLFDMGGEYQCYASDITCSFPVNGKFSDNYKPVYEGVLNAQRVVLKMMKPGISWVDCHVAAEIEVVKALHTIGIVVLPDTDASDEDAVHNKIAELVVSDDRLGAVFMPHGLGHFIGIDTHDVGGYLQGLGPERSPLPGLKKLRTARVLEEDMVLTVEPGCYFIDHLLDEIVLSNGEHKLFKYINNDILKEYRGTGGVRLEDVVAVTSDGCENYTTCPRTIQEVEHVMSGGKWPPIQDDAPELKRINLTKTSLF